LKIIFQSIDYTNFYLAGTKVQQLLSTLVLLWWLVRHLGSNHACEGRTALSNQEKTIRRAILSIAATAVLCAAPLTNADTLGTSGFVKGSQTFGLSIGGSPSTGGFAGTWNATDIVFWCIELTQNFSFGGQFSDYTPSQPNNATFTLLGQLFHEAYGEATVDEKHSAAFQLAIWEIVYESGDLNLGGGNFKVLNNNGHADTVLLAQSYLDNLWKFTDNYDLYLLHSASHQDFVTFGRPFSTIQVVPEPAPALLLATALLAMIFVLRRRASGKRA
jgi:hypothetical protein